MLEAAIEDAEPMAAIEDAEPMAAIEDAGVRHVTALFSRYV